MTNGEGVCGRILIDCVRGSEGEHTTFWKLQKAYIDGTENLLKALQMYGVGSKLLNSIRSLGALRLARM